MIMGMGVLLTKTGLRGLQCTRAFSRPAVFEGEEGEMVEIVRNDRPMLIPWLRVESHISPHLRLGRIKNGAASSAAADAKDNLHVSGSRYYCSLFTLLPYQQIRRRHRVTFLHRGAYDLGNASSFLKSTFEFAFADERFRDELKGFLQEFLKKTDEKI